MHDRCDGCARPLALSNHPYQRCRIARRLADASTLQVARPPQQTARRIVPPFAKLLGRLSARTPRGDPGGPLRCSRHARQRATRGAFLLHGSVNRIPSPDVDPRPRRTFACAVGRITSSPPSRTSGASTCSPRNIGGRGPTNRRAEAPAGRETLARHRERNSLSVGPSRATHRARPRRFFEPPNVVG